jgi:hypothetical protein
MWRDQQSHHERNWICQSHLRQLHASNTKSVILGPLQTSMTGRSVPFGPFAPTDDIDVPAEGLYNGLVLVAFEALDDHLQTSQQMQHARVRALISSCCRLLQLEAAGGTHAQSCTPA